MQPYPSLGDLHNPGIEPGSPALQAVVCIAGRLFTIEHIYSFLGTRVGIFGGYNFIFHKS